MNELSCGITEYLTDACGFAALVKQRYSDFIVHEIDKNDKIVKLDDLSAPSNVPEVPTSSKSTASKQELIDLIGQSLIDQLHELVDQKLATKPLFLPCDCKDKVHRTRIHQLIRQAFDGQLDSKTTTNSDGKQTIEVGYCHPSSESRKRTCWPSDVLGGDFCRFVLYKENKDMQQSLALIASLLYVKANSFKVAGTKDKRAITSQLVTVYRISSDRLSSLNKRLFGIKLGNFEYVKNELQLGDLNGNRFSVVLRNINESEDVVFKLVEKWKSMGFINYFGTQRFGSKSVSTYSIGKELLAGNWQKAVDLILAVKSSDDALREACEIWQCTRDAEKALAAVPYRLRVMAPEAHLLIGLSASESHNNYRDALNRIQHNTCLLYLHSYQSFLWNKIVSCRISKFGTALLVGDIVAANDLIDKTQDVAKENHVKHISQHELDDGTYSIYDLLMPLPGHAVLLPDNEIRRIYEQILEEEGLTANHFKGKEKKFWLSGDYRNVFEKPHDVSFEFSQYDDPNIPLFQTDLNVLEGEALQRPEKAGQATSRFLALKLEFSLSACCYATVALRELMKNDTSSTEQIKQMAVSKEQL